MSVSALLLRAPSEDGSGPDKYKVAFQAQGYRAISVPVLETVHTNITQLADTLRAGASSSKYAGVIVTSGRSCETWREAVQRLTAEETSREEQGGEDRWSIPFYAVGEATVSALKAIATAFPSSPYIPRDVRGGADSGTGEKLAHFIVADLAGKATLPLLYLIGDKNRDTLPNILNGAGIALESLQVYATKGSSRFEDDLRDGLGLKPFGHDSQSNDHWWIVFFAPSSAKHVTPILNRYFALPAENGNDVSSSLRQTHVAAIGPTTASSLRSELNIHVHVVAEKPTPEALIECIARWDNRQ